MTGEGTPGENGSGDETITEISVADLVARLEDESVVTTDEATAVAAAISAHRSDQRRAAAQAEPDGTTDRVDEWRLEGRLRKNGAYGQRRPRDVERGSEWRMAGRLQ